MFLLEPRSPKNNRKTTVDYFLAGSVGRHAAVKAYRGVKPDTRTASIRIAHHTEAYDQGQPLTKR